MVNVVPEEPVKPVKATPVKRTRKKKSDPVDNSPNTDIGPVRDMYVMKF